MSDDIPDTPPEDEEGRAVWTIRRLTKALTGQVLSHAQAKVLYDKTKEKVVAAMAQSTGTQP